MWILRQFPERRPEEGSGDSWAVAGCFTTLHKRPLFNIGEHMGKYWDINKTLSYNTLFNFVVGPRGAGKTYGAKNRGIQNYLRKNEQFVYVRRYETEMPGAEMKNFFNDIEDKYQDHDFKSGQGLFRIDGDIVGWYVPLSKAQMLKSIPFPNVSMIIFDEFIIDTGVYHYLKNEVTSFLEMYSTISRDRDIPVFFLSNAITYTNPYFLYFDINLQEGQRLKIKGDISLELVENAEFTEHMKNTRFGKLIAGTEYGNYSIENKFFRDTDTFIEKMENAGRYLMTIVADSVSFGVYMDDVKDLIYISEKVDKTGKRVTMDTDNHDPNTLLLKKSGSVILSMMVDYYSRGNLRFETIQAKNICTKLLRRLF